VTDSQTNYPIKEQHRHPNPRLFHCSEASGTFKVQEIYPFCQDDLDRHDCYILDAFSVIYVWQYDAKWASPTEKKMTMETALRYATVAAGKDGRPEHIPVYFVPGGSKKEPLVFTTHFHAWEPTPKVLDPGLESVQNILQEFTKKYTYKELLDKEFPPGMDTSNLEIYIEDEEFESVFNMPRSEFQKMPLWQRQKLKRHYGLF